MSTSSLLLLGVGGAGSRMARGICRAFGGTIRFATADTDAISGQGGDDFILLGADRLAGRGSGGDSSLARVATEDSISTIDSRLEGVRMAVVVTALGGGTGSASTLIILKRLKQLGITTIVFATMPFSFEGDERIKNANAIKPSIEEESNASFIISLDKLISNEDNMELAMARAVDSMASGVTLFWRLLEKPGFIRFDPERLRKIISSSGKGKFLSVTKLGPDRAWEAIEQLKHSPFIDGKNLQTKNIIVGVLAGYDLRLSEIGCIMDGVKEIFGTEPTYELATVNDEETFSGRLSLVVMALDAAQSPLSQKPSKNRRSKSSQHPQVLGYVSSRGYFDKTLPTIYNGQDLDEPTYIRQNITIYP